MNKNYQICKRCIMDTSDPEIQFDEDGFCNHCKKYFVRVSNEVFTGEEGQKRLSEITEKIKSFSQGKEYDCVIGVSGGVDSTTVAYLVKKWGLRPLAVHFDNGWDSELAVENIKRMLELLKIDLHTHVVDWEEFRDLQLSFLKASVHNCEIPTDHAILALLYKTAYQHNIKYIILGGNVATEGIMPDSWGYSSYDLQHIKAIHKRFGTKSLKTFPQLSLWRFLYYILIKKIRVIPILNYIEYKKSEAIKILQKELGWRYYGGKHYESIYTRFFQGYILPTKFGVDKRCAHLSTLICSGDINREDALAEMKTTPYANNNLTEDKVFVIKKLGLTDDEFESLMSLPVKSHADYPSHSLIFDRMADLRASFKRNIATKP